MTKRLIAKLNSIKAVDVFKRIAKIGKSIADRIEAKETIFKVPIAANWKTKTSMKIMGLAINTIPAAVVTPLPPLKPKKND